MYMVDARGRVFDKHFVADHAVRESVNDALQESFQVDLPTDCQAVARGAHLAARAWFPSSTIRRAQLLVLTVDLDIGPGLHVYGQPLPEGYVPMELQVDEDDLLRVESIQYPEAASVTFAALGETLPAYAGP